MGALADRRAKKARLAAAQKKAKAAYDKKRRENATTTPGYTGKVKRRRAKG